MANGQPLTASRTRSPLEMLQTLQQAWSRHGNTLELLLPRGWPVEVTFWNFGASPAMRSAPPATPVLSNTVTALCDATLAANVSLIK